MTVVYGRQFTPEVWNVIRNNEILQPAGKVIPTSITAEEKGHDPIDEKDWTDPMRRLAAYTQAVSLHLLGTECMVEFHNLPRVRSNAGRGVHCLAWWGDNTLTFNLGALGKKWPEAAEQVAVDKLLIHELAHSRASDHLSERFYEACCEFGARLRDFPERLRSHADCFSRSWWPAKRTLTRPSEACGYSLH